MNTGFKDLDKLIDLNKPELILLSGTYFVDMLSGDIANNIMLKQDEERHNNVLEIVDCKKEYVIKRLFVNECNVDYRNWSLKNQYSDDELKQIGKTMVNLIEVTKRLPTIIEANDVYFFDFKKLEKFILDYANINADSERIDTLIILDIFPINNNKWNKYKQIDSRKIVKFIKKIQKISHKLAYPIIVIYGVDMRKAWSEEKWSYITKNDLTDINKVNKYVDKFVILNHNDTEHLEHITLFDLDVYNSREKIGSCKLKYNRTYRRFEDYA